VLAEMSVSRQSGTRGAIAESPMHNGSAVLAEILGNPIYKSRHFLIKMPVTKSLMPIPNSKCPAGSSHLHRPPTRTHRRSGQCSPFYEPRTLTRSTSGPTFFSLFGNDYHLQ
jgi:hypothetical protein